MNNSTHQNPSQCPSLYILSTINGMALSSVYIAGCHHHSNHGNDSDEEDGHDARHDHKDENNDVDGRAICVRIARFASMMMQQSTKCYIVEYCHGGIVYILLQLLHNDKYFVVISGPGQVSRLKLKALQIAHMIQLLFSPQLQYLADDAYIKSSKELSQTTFQDTIGGDCDLYYVEDFVIFEDHYVRSVLEMADISSTWLSPLLNNKDIKQNNKRSFPDFISFSLIMNNDSDRTSIIQLNGRNLSQSIWNDIVKAYFALKKNLSQQDPNMTLNEDVEEFFTAGSIIIIKEGLYKDFALLIQPSTVHGIYLAFAFPGKWVSFIEINEETSSTTVELPGGVAFTSKSCFTPTMMESLEAVLYRFSLTFRDCSDELSQPYSVDFIASLLALPSAPSPSDKGGLKPVPPTSPPKQSHSSSNSFRRGVKISISPGEPNPEMKDIT